MLLLKAEKIKKIYGERTVLELDELFIYTNDRIGIVGANGAGKTTLFEILSGNLQPEEGRVQRYGEISYCRQFQREESANDNRTEEVVFDSESEGQTQKEEAKRWGISQLDGAEKISGGEEMRKKLAEVFSGNRHLLLLDEPTANLDSEGIAQLIGQLQKVESFLCISHDRQLLNDVCTQILEVCDGKIRLYPGNYQAYEQIKEEEKQNMQREYEEYVQEKGRLETVYRKKRESAERMVKIPKNMTPKEARLRDFLTVSGRSSSGKQKNMNRAADNVKKRIEHMEVKEKPKKEIVMHLNFSRTNPPQSRKILEAKDLHFSYGDHLIFDKASFSVGNHKKTALLGPNGSGKTTLFRILEEAADQDIEGLRIVPRVKIGVLKQDFSQLEPDKTVLENAVSDSVQEISAVKNVLAGLLFSVDDWNKKVSVLSGGEKMKLAFAKLLVSSANVLLLDEPTNYLDLLSIQALETQLQAYEGAVLLISHDREFVRRIADELLMIEDHGIRKFSGTLNEFEEAQKRKVQKKLITPGIRLAQEERMRLELQLARLSGQLSHAPSLEEKERLEGLYWEIVGRLREI